MNVKDVIVDMHQGINTVADKVEYLNEGIPIIQSKNFTKGYLDLEDVRYLGKDDEEKYIEKYNPHVGDILMANIGTIGKSFVITEEEKFLIAWNVFLIKPNHELVLSDFLKFYFDYLASTHYFDKLLTGGTVKFINKKKIGDIPFPKKDILEQQEIVKKLSVVENIVITRRKELEKLDELIKARFVEMFGKLDKKVSVSHMCDVSGGYSFKSGDITSDGSIKILQIGNVYLNDVNWDTINYLPEGYDKTYSRFLLNEGDIVVALTRPIIQSLGNVKACIVKERDMPCLLNQRVGRIVPKKDKDVSIEFIYGCLMTDEFTRYVESCCIGCSQPNISTKDIENYMIPNASFEEQLEFVKFRDQVDKSKSIVQKSLEETQKLFDSLMQKYFG